MLDKIFGENNFRNEIIWCYKLGGRPLKGWPKKHDTILFYTKNKNEDFIFNSDAVRVPYDSTGGYISSGRKIVKGKEYKIHPLGKVPEDWWFISALNRQSKERLGYPTQKPELLLERIIKASSNKGNIVLDPFCGCGTTVVVAQKLKRTWIGIDISPTAIKVVEQRLYKIGAEKDIDYISIGSPTTIDELKELKPLEFQNWVINEMQAKHRRKDKGLDGYISQDLYRENAGIQVKQSENVGRDKIDYFRSALQREKYQKGYIVGFSFSKGATNEVARLKNAGEILIRLIKVADLLEKKILLD
jgi:hypothetical protein